MGTSTLLLHPHPPRRAAQCGQRNGGVMQSLPHLLRATFPLTPFRLSYICTFNNFTILFPHPRCVCDLLGIHGASWMLAWFLSYILETLQHCFCPFSPLLCALQSQYAISLPCPHVKELPSLYIFHPFFSLEMVFWPTPHFHCVWCAVGPTSCVPKLGSCIFQH